MCNILTLLQDIQNMQNVCVCRFAGGDALMGRKYESALTLCRVKRMNNYDVWWVCVCACVRADEENETMLISEGRGFGMFLARRKPNTNGPSGVHVALSSLAVLL